MLRAWDPRERSCLAKQVRRVFLHRKISRQKHPVPVIRSAPPLPYLDTTAVCCLALQELHVNQQGRGALGDLAAGGPAAGEMVVSSGADGTVCITDPRM